MNKFLEKCLWVQKKYAIRVSVGSDKGGIKKKIVKKHAISVFASGIQDGKFCATPVCLQNVSQRLRVK
ncbi:MAG TPA: hypothetical protein VHY30_09765 [Verrucomicrobiae bacterium]|nr:hypothetical protein [Verrucomicrobiae bacterium]